MLASTRQHHFPHDPPVGQAKRNQQRDCPALAEAITPTICASQRLSEIACPGSCTHNPFNPVNYLTSYQVIEAAVVKNLSIMLHQDADFQHLGRIKKAIRERDALRTNALYAWHIHGESRVAKWCDQGAFRVTPQKQEKGGLAN